MTCELWHLTGGSMIGSFEDRGEALDAVQAYLVRQEALALLAEHLPSGVVR